MVKTYPCFVRFIKYRVGLFYPAYLAADYAANCHSSECFEKGNLTLDLNWISILRVPTQSMGTRSMKIRGSKKTNALAFCLKRTLSIKNNHALYLV